MGAVDPATRRRLKAAKRRYLIDYKAEMGCRVCGERDPVVLDLDHTDPASKTRNGGPTRTAVTDWVALSWKGIERELAKCQVLCANCHRRKTAIQLGWHRLDGLPGNQG